MKIHAAMIVYNDCTFLAAALESLKQNVDSIIVVDGAYQKYYETICEHNPQAKPYSTDGTLEIIQLIHDLPPTKIIHVPDGKPWLNQLEKRNALLSAIPDGDWFIGIDADEILLGEVREGFKTIMDSGCIVGRVPLYHAGLDKDRLHMFWHPRIFRKVEGMHYKGTHWHLRDKFDRIIEEVYPVMWTDKFVIAHLKAFKPISRLKTHEAYMEKIAEQGWLEPFQT